MKVNNMEKEYAIEHWLDDVYKIYKKDDPERRMVAKGDVEFCNAWLSLNDKGYFNHE